MHLGVAVPISGSWATTDNIVEIATLSEELGYHSLWTFQRLLAAVDHDGSPLLLPQYRSVLDPIALLAYLAAITDRVRLGVAVLNLPFASPVVTAKSLTTIDRLSAGRLDVGLGTGWQAQEFEATGVTMDRRGARADDYLRALDAIWTDDVADYHGEFYDVPRSSIEPRPVQSPRPPILMGGAAPAALRRAGRLADGWISSSLADLTRIDEQIDIVRTAATDAGRDPDALRFVTRGVIKVRGAGAADRSPLTGSIDEIRADLDGIAAKGVHEVFLDLNFDPEVGSPDADPDASMALAREVIRALAPS